MSTRRFITAFALPSVVLLFVAFWFGSQESLVFALTGFLACFLISVTLLVEGWKKYKKASKKET